MYLPDGNVKFVEHLGDMCFNDNVILTDVLIVPSFKFNLLSVRKLCITSRVKFEFYAHCCLLQDLLTDKVIAVGRVIENLYVLDKSSFHSTISRYIDVLQKEKSLYRISSCEKKGCKNTETISNVLDVNKNSGVLWH